MQYGNEITPLTDHISNSNNSSKNDKFIFHYLYNIPRNDNRRTLWQNTHIYGYHQKIKILQDRLKRCLRAGLPKNKSFFHLSSTLSVNKMYFFHCYKFTLLIALLLKSVDKKLMSFSLYSSNKSAKCREWSAITSVLTPTSK